MLHFPRPLASLMTASLLLVPVLLVRNTQAIAPFDPYADAVVGATLVTDAPDAVGAPDGDTAVLSATLGSGIELDMGAGEEGTGDLTLYYSNSMSGAASTRVTFYDASKTQLDQRTVDLPMTGMDIGTVRVPYGDAPTPYRYVHVASLITSFGLDAVEADTYRPDSDDDGLPDQWEIDHGLDPLDGSGDNGPDGDPDNDGLTNAEELVAGTHPKQADTDGDGLPDGWELDHGLDPLDPNGPNGCDGDPDGDGLTNCEEYQLGRNPATFDNVKYYVPLIVTMGN